MNKTYPSPIKPISVEKIIIPFTFERAYCPLAIFLFICLWRKGMNKTYPSPIKPISVEKIIIPFTFERAYCRIGVTTDNSGLILRPLNPFQ